MVKWVREELSVDFLSNLANDLHDHGSIPILYKLVEVIKVKVAYGYLGNSGFLLFISKRHMVHDLVDIGSQPIDVP